MILVMQLEHRILLMLLIILCFIFGAEDFLMLMIFVSIAIMN